MFLKLSQRGELLLSNTAVNQLPAPPVVSPNLGAPHYKERARLNRLWNIPKIDISTVQSIKSEKGIKLFLSVFFLLSTWRCILNRFVIVLITYFLLQFQQQPLSGQNCRKFGQKIVLAFTFVENKFSYSRNVFPFNYGNHLNVASFFVILDHLLPSK